MREKVKKNMSHKETLFNSKEIRKIVFEVTIPFLMAIAVLVPLILSEGHFKDALLFFSTSAKFVFLPILGLMTIFFIGWFFRVTGVIVTSMVGEIEKETPKDLLKDKPTSIWIGFFSILLFSLSSLIFVLIAFLLGALGWKVFTLLV
jgi:hypothetical protein